MQAFLAIVYICASAIPAAECGDANAIDVFRTRVASELGCTSGWQEILARSAFTEGLGRDSYVKTACRRIQPVPPRAP